MRNVYGFTNENVSSFGSLYDFSAAKVLSVLGSGDQYFASLLHGADEVDVFDVDMNAWDFFVLKFCGLMTLSYDDFFSYYVLRRLNDEYRFNFLSKYMPDDVVSRLKRKYERCNGLSNYLTSDIASVNYGDGHVIPYFEKNEYYRLQRMLWERELPNFYLDDFVKLSDKLPKGSHDIVLASNIFYWWCVDDGVGKVSEFKGILDKFDCPNIQAMYMFAPYEQLESEFLRNGFDIDCVPSSNSFHLYDDKVVSLRKIR